MMSELQIPVKQQDDGMHGHGYNQGIDDCMPLIQQLQTKLAESEARVARLLEAAKVKSNDNCADDVLDRVKEVLNETKSQSLQHIQAEAVEKFAEWFDERGLNGYDSDEVWQSLQKYIDQLRQQSTKGSDGDE